MPRPFAHPVALVEYGASGSSAILLEREEAEEIEAELALEHDARRARLEQTVASFDREYLSERVAKLESARSTLCRALGEQDG